MNAVKELLRVAAKIEKKLGKTAQVVTQVDIGTGEQKAILAAAGPALKNILNANKVADKMEYIEFQAVATAPNYATRSVNLDSVEVFVGYDEPEASNAQKANEQIMSNLKSTIEHALLSFYRTAKGVAVLKGSGTPPSIKAVIKIKKQDLA